MEVSYYLVLVTFFFFLIHKLFIRNRVVRRNLPPSLPGLPIIGHYHLLKRLIHFNLHDLSKKYGPILFFHFSSRPVLVISTLSVIEEGFIKNDITFANRPFFASRKIAEYNFTTLVTCPYGHHWRNLHRLTTIEIFSSTRIQGPSSIRAEEIHFLVKQLFKSSFREVEIESFFYILTFRIMMKLVTRHRYLDDDVYSDNNRGIINDLKQMFNPILNLSWSDHFPTLRWLTFQGADNRILKMHKEKVDFLQALVDMHQHVIFSPFITDGERKRLIIDVMLSFQESKLDCYTDEIIKGIIMVMFTAETVTSTSTMESAVSHLISHPEVFRKAREEIYANIGQSKLLHDVDLGKLPYLHCIINETFRLGSTGLIIPPYKSSKECMVGSYNIPQGTMLLVNAFALYNDTKLWEDPDMFKPERLQGRGWEGERGRYKFIPFGLGRRQCPGKGLAMRFMALTLGTLIQCFEWRKAGEDCQVYSVAANVRKKKDVALKVIFRPCETLASSILSQL